MQMKERMRALTERIWRGLPDSLNLLKKYADAEGAKEETGMQEYYHVQVITKNGPLNLRDAPGGKVMAEIPAGTVMDAAGSGEWLHVKHEGMSGYAAARYLEPVAQEAERIQMVLTDETGSSWIPQGEFKVQMRKVED